MDLDPKIIIKPISKVWPRSTGELIKIKRVDDKEKVPPYFEASLDKETKTIIKAGTSEGIVKIEIYTSSVYINFRPDNSIRGKIYELEKESLKDAQLKIENGLTKIKGITYTERSIPPDDPYAFIFDLGKDQGPVLSDVEKMIEECYEGSGKLMEIISTKIK